jgi:hypothetical protein
MLEVSLEVRLPREEGQVRGFLCLDSGFLEVVGLLLLAVKTAVHSGPIV